MQPLHPITLAFTDKSLERDFYEATYARTVEQGRAAIILGVMLYLLYGVLDRWSVPEQFAWQVWAIRCAALCVPAIVFSLTFTPWFVRNSHFLLALIGLAAGVGFIGMFLLIPVDKLSLYYPSLVLVVFFTYNLLGTRFIYALGVDIVLLVAYNLIFAWWKSYPAYIMVSHDFLIVYANLIGGAAGYFNEYQRRLLFLRERKIEEQRLRHLHSSLHDNLTGLANRELLFDRMEQALAHSHRDGTPHAGYYIDLDGFKRINDEQGHEIGDQVLKQAAATLQSSVRETDTVSRLGCDEFFILAYGVNNIDDAVSEAEKLLALVKTSSRLATGNAHLSASLGICLFPYPNASPADIIRRADQAMYCAKKSGKDRYQLADLPSLGQVSASAATKIKESAL
jgi:diguanylate cyclase